MVKQEGCSLPLQHKMFTQNIASLLATLFIFSLYCGTEGVTWWCANHTANHGDYIRYQTVVNMEQCQSYCLQERRCKAALLKIQNKRCYLMPHGWAEKDRYTNDTSFNLCEKASPGRCDVTPGLCGSSETCVDGQFGRYECMPGTCHDATGSIDNGRIDCTLTHTENRYQYQCNISCIPGYLTAPSSNNTCKGQQGEQPKISPPQSFVGLWTFPIEEASCTLPTVCPEIPQDNFSEHGYIDCHSEGRDKKCVRKCRFPYVPTEPDLVEEYCGNDTQFFWSHVLRNNDNQMPPCKVKTECSNLELARGKFICYEEPWARSTFCKLRCDPGYISNNTNDDLFCGPNTAFRWSNEWSDLTGVSKELGCIESPITVWVVFSQPCHTDQRQEITEALMKIFESANKDINGSKIWELVNWETVCDSEDENSIEPKLVYVFNFQDLCIDGTCMDACNLLLTHNTTKLTQCREICNEDFANTNSILTQMHNITIRYIAKSLASTKSEITGHFGEGFKSMKVKAVDVKYEEDPCNDKCHKKATNNAVCT